MTGCMEGSNDDSALTAYDSWRGGTSDKTDVMQEIKYLAYSRF